MNAKRSHVRVIRRTLLTFAAEKFKRKGQRKLRQQEVKLTATLKGKELQAQLLQ